MVDKMPRLFRSLETRQGRSAFDTIATAAVAGFLDMRRPGPAHAADFARLIASTWPKLSTETKRQIAISLAKSPDVPRPVVELFLNEPAEIAAPFLFSSPCLTETDVLSLQAAEEAVPPAEAARVHLPRQSVEPNVQRSDGAGKETAPPPLKNAAAARDALRALVRAKPRPAQPGAQTSETAVFRLEPGTPPFPALLHEARNGNPGGAARAIASTLKLPAQTAVTLVEGEDGTFLAAALKLLDLTTADAMTLVLMVHRTAGHDATAFAALRRVYDGLTKPAARELLGLEAATPIDVPVKRDKGQHQPLHVEGAGLRKGTATRKTTFGRRRQLPSAVAGRRVD
ncbi:hypothetical protein [Jiella mangrovi]|uniref:DUF2336 domain-containing protein n=1 Tax=Jiella mangrovi TaxID=2821407 RepID=A0ABS4BMN0_9HYPH|nr:hypothetical protein [Jiella mangrovi]MBP0617911.1 hypothetical protein [Jiella mangrovi]